MVLRVEKYGRCRWGGCKCGCFIFPIPTDRDRDRLPRFDTSESPAPLPRDAKITVGKLARDWMCPTPCD